MNEKRIMAETDHPFCIRLIAAYKDRTHLYMVLEICQGGELFSLLQKERKLDEPASAFYGASVMLAFEYLHNRNIIYRDLKPENLLLDGKGYLKVVDFGFAKLIKDRTWTLCGTPEYLAPETIRNKGHGKGVDWWTLGILMYEMMVGQPPFVDDDPMGIYQQILNGKLNFPRFIEKNAKSLIKKLLVADLTKRFGCLKNGAADIKKHKFFSGLDYESLLKRELTAPVIPLVKDDTDTSNFDPYPDSVEEAPMPVFSGKDPFSEF